MKDLLNVKEAVLAQAKAEALELREKTQNDIQIFLQQEEKKAKEKYEVLIDESKQLIAKERSQHKASLAMSYRQAILGKKQEIIENVKLALLQAMGELPEAEKKILYQQILSKILKKNNIKIQELSSWTIALNEKDQSLFSDLATFASELKLSLDDDILKSRGGFILKSKLVQLNYTFEELIKQDALDLAMEINKFLFN